jgi:hypothetical protein
VIRVRTMFAIYLLVTLAGLGVYITVGLAHH